MTIFPESVHRIIKASHKRYPENITAATDLALGKIRQLEEFDSIVDSMLRDSVRHMICDQRHSLNTKAKRDAGAYGKGQRHSRSSTTGVREVYERAYDYYIAGTTLGSLKGEDLLGIAEKERKLARGHDSNATLLERLHPLVREGQTVRAAVPAKKLWKMLEEAGVKSQDDDKAA